MMCSSFCDKAIFLEYVQVCLITPLPHSISLQSLGFFGVFSGFYFLSFMLLLSVCGAGVGRVNVPDFTRIFILSYCLTISNISSYHFAGFIDAGKILAFKNIYYFLTIVC